MDTKKIADFKPGDDVQGFFMVKECEEKTTTTNKSYLDMILMDDSGEINAKLWDTAVATSNDYSKDSIIKIRGSVSLWQNRNQLKILKIRNATEEDQVRMEDFVPCAPWSPDEMYQSIKGYVDRIQQPDIKTIVSVLMEEKHDKLMYYPAAKSNHHAIRSGLMYHVLRMLQMGESICGVYPELNTDLIYAGIILHDIAKIDEMNANTLGIVSEYSRDGQLLGHLIQGIKDIDRVAREHGLDQEVVSVIEHMILSHHYEPEFGSPKKPMFPEAEVLHYIDIIDARIYDMKRVLDQVEGGSFSEPVWVLDRRRLFKPTFLSNNGSDTTNE